MRRVTEPPQVNKTRYVRKCYKNDRVRFTCTDHAFTRCNIAVKQGLDSIIGSYMPILPVRDPPVGIVS